MFYGIIMLRIEGFMEDNLKLIGIDFYNCYKEDVKLFVEMGFKVFCIFIVWF